MPYWRLYYHAVWATSGREPWLTEEVERMVCGAIPAKAREMGVIVNKVGAADDHIHVALSVPPKLAVAECIKGLKGASSRYVSANARVEGYFAWQNGYGIVSFAERALPAIMRYVEQQREHHRGGTVKPALEADRAGGHHTR